MLALYEASQLRVKGEDILDEALEFTATHLESFELSSNPNLANQVKHALYQQLRNCCTRKNSVKSQGKSEVERMLFSNIIQRSSTMKDLVRAYNTEAKWFIGGYLPRFDEYMGIGTVTSTYFLIATTSFLGMAELTIKEAFDWLRTKPKSFMACITIYQFVDDVATYEVEKGTGQIATGIECYVKEHDVSKEDRGHE
ncbi:hypothetical protein RJ639_024064 [Escallonia herrerae]|uniref:Terpene synthase metal-binding domain-containing protein n=1 Tax=Escallonia herrerae TaxID=1293975 RepID=A0AA88V0T1_9ASTE|nr:hypothetical protein RJ639_024064 [Escallonia herrerae]